MRLGQRWPCYLVLDPTPNPAGAYLTEGGVHFVAALRLAAGAAGFGQAVAAAAASRGVSQDLPHPDCLQGLLWFESGERRTNVRCRVAKPGNAAAMNLHRHSQFDPTLAHATPTSAIPAGASASVSITTAAGSASIALHVVGTEGTAEAARGGMGFTGSRAFRLVQQGGADAAPTQVRSSLLPRPELQVVGGLLPCGWCC